ncbi:MAG: hypothetical protein ACPGTU_08615, partial [Myxococcota bacterium]
MILLLAQIAVAATIQPSVEVSSDLAAVHVLVGAQGEQVSSCGLIGNEWGCQPIEVDGPQPMAVLLDTTLVRLGAIEPVSDTMTVQVNDGVAEVVWDEDAVPVSESNSDVFLVLLKGASSDPAPMVNILFGGQTSEARCGDDGRFPDLGINDGVFTCALVTPTVDTEANEATFQLRLGPVQEEPLGTVEYSASPGLRFAQLTVGDPDAAVGKPFALPVGSSSDPQKGDKPTILSPKEIAIDAGEYSEEPAPAPVVSSSSSSGWVSSSSSGWVETVLALSLVIVGVLMGRYTRRGGVANIEGVEIVRLDALDGNGPIPDTGAVLVHADPPRHAFLHLARTLTPYRRLVLVSVDKPTDIQPGLDVVWVSDPDWRSIAKVVNRLSQDGGVPAVVLIEGMDSVLDVGGASPTPVLDLIDEL